MSDPNSFSKSPDLPVLRDAQHASRVFVDSDQKYAPKVKFLYHVVFSSSKASVANPLSMLVKAVELPGFTVETQTLNQYNRKRHAQVKIDYKPVTIKFYDDNDGVTRRLWEEYYKYYYDDSSAAGTVGAYNRTAMKSYINIRGQYGYNGQSSAFFDSITIYQMGRKQWNSYKLINPIITAWNHDMLDYSQSQAVEQTLTLLYEAVEYGSGAVNADSPPGFATTMYDTTPSPYVSGSQSAVESVASAVASGVSAVSGVLGAAVASAYNGANSVAAAVPSAVLTAASSNLSSVTGTNFPVAENVAATTSTLKTIVGQ